VDISFTVCVCLCLFVWLRISLLRIKLAASNFGGSSASKAENLPFCEL